MGREEINEAMQQFVGFKVGKWGADILELISSMGLEEPEWNHIKENEDPDGFIDEDDIKRINKHFEDQE